MRSKFWCLEKFDECKYTEYLWKTPQPIHINHVELLMNLSIVYKFKEVVMKEILFILLLYMSALHSQNTDELLKRMYSLKSIEHSPGLKK